MGRPEAAAEQADLLHRRGTRPDGAAAGRGQPYREARRLVPPLIILPSAQLLSALVKKAMQVHTLRESLVDQCKLMEGRDFSSPMQMILKLCCLPYE